MEIGNGADIVLKEIIKTMITHGSPEMAEAITTGLANAADQLDREFMTGDAGQVRQYAQYARLRLDEHK